MKPKTKQSKKDFNIKSDLSKLRKMIVETQREDDEARKKEDDIWREAEGPKSRASKKREDKAEKRTNAAARKAQARRLAKEEEMKEIGNSLNEKVRLMELREAAEAEMKKTMRKKEKMMSRTMTKYEYQDMVLVENTNVVDDSVMRTHAIEDTLAHLSLMDKLSPKEIHRYYFHIGKDIEFLTFKL